MATKNTMSVHLDDEITLALNRVREEMRQRNEESEIKLQLPSLGWLARSMLREKLGLVEGEAAKKDNSGSV
ncbi:hypothetical protein [Klebsiella aerogenes]|uniref:hypothetical protein n=1 Tax=Klebsiella aerogenes TaxID=548 RepID=UPI002E33657D|nr:hypothetical protein [Klebsiella aerogenes]